MERHDIDWPYRVLAGTYLDTFPPSTWQAGSAALPPREPLRPVAWSPPGSPTPAWLAGPHERPRVYVTLGTVVFGATHALDAALGALEADDVDVLVAVGPEGDPGALKRRGDRIHVERFVDQARVIPQVDAVVHHGGSGTALAALAAGLPQVLMPQGADQFQNAEMLVSLGAARAFLPGMADDVLAEHIHAALAGGEMTVAASNFAREIAAMPSPADVANRLAALRSVS
jgi:UDP:flavonoid glycosyltransferase YjiC (YdhE family)